MRKRVILRASLLVWIVVFALLEKAGSAREAAGATKDRVAILGASLSQGFGARPGWGAAFAASRAIPPEVVSEHCTLFFFAKPVEHGTSLAEKARAADPTLVLAVDFLFWFGYGAVDISGGKLASEDDRLRLLDRGLSLLEPFTCPLVIGDFPDASPAVGKILAPEQMPAPKTLAALNKRVGDWAATRTNVVVLPLAEWMAQIRHGRTIRIGAHEFGKEAAAEWLQKDQLHPTSEGLIALAMLVNERLTNRGHMTPDKAVGVPSEIRRKMAVALREQRQRQFRDLLAHWHREAAAHPEGSVERLETLGRGLVMLCRMHPDESSAAEELVRVLEQLPKDRASALARQVNRPTAPEIVRAKLSNLLGPESAPATNSTGARQP